MIVQSVLVFILASIPVLGTRLGAKNEGGWKVEPILGSGVSDNGHRQLNEEGSFLVSQVRQNQDWCIVAPDLDWPDNQPSYQESRLRFGHCEPYFDAYQLEGRKQLFSLCLDGKIRSQEYPGLCMIVNDGVNIGGGLMRLDDCDINSDLNRFCHESDPKNIRLASPNDGYCVTNEGSTPNVGDTIHAKPCRDGGRYEFEFQEARYYWQIIVAPSILGCMMPRNGKIPTRRDKVYIDHCGSPEDAWGFEETGTGAVLFHNKLDYNMCMQSGNGGPPGDGTKMRYYPCDRSNALQRFMRVFSGDGYTYKITPESRTDLCVVPHGSTVEVGDEVILKVCSNAATDVDTFYDDEAG